MALYSSNAMATMFKTFQAKVLVEESEDVNVGSESFSDSAFSSVSRRHEPCVAFPMLLKAVMIVSNSFHFVPCLFGMECFFLFRLMFAVLMVSFTAATIPILIKHIP